MIITDNMRRWALALVAAEKRYREDGFAGKASAILATADASESVKLSEQEEQDVRQLIQEDRLDELAMVNGKGKHGMV